MAHLSAYASIGNLRDRNSRLVFGQPVYVQEKVDGSQFSFGLVQMEDGSTELLFRSKGSVFRAGGNGMFNPAVTAVTAIQSQLPLGYTFRGEFLSKPRHNVLRYDRTPLGHIVLFDIQNDKGEFVPQTEVQVAAKFMGFDYAPILDYADMTEAQVLANMPSYLKHPAVLGGQIEGVVIKPASRVFLPDGTQVLVKIVSDAFKEVKVDRITGNSNANGMDEVTARIIARYATNQRYQKAFQHLQDEGLLSGSMKDIPLIIREVQADILKEEEQHIKDELYNAVKKDLLRGFVKDVAGWYQNRNIEGAPQEEP